MENQTTPMSGELISATASPMVQLTSQGLTRGVKRQLNHDAQLMVRETMKAQMLVQARAMVAQTAIQAKIDTTQKTMLQVANLGEMELRLATMSPTVAADLEVIKNTAVFSILNNLQAL